MVEVDVLRWRVRLDVQRTREAYAQTTSGGAADCRCAYCENYLQQHERAFPARVQRILETVGIPANNNLEVVEYGPCADGRRLYGAWFYVVGELARGDRSEGQAAEDFEDVSPPRTSHTASALSRPSGPSSAANSPR